ncbi:MAG: PepSY-associated TM helix domain-containing protein [Thermonemataceae bacterium]
MKFNKKTFFRLHSWIGVKLSILFFIVCFSGTLATLSHEMDWLLNPATRATPSVTTASKDLIVKNVYKAYPTGKITYWMGAPLPYLCDIIYVEVEKQRWYVFANPYTGEVQGASALTFQRFFRDLHYFLFIPFQVGHFTVLIFGFLLFISLGTALFFYKKWYRKLFDLEVGKGRVVFFRSLHRLVGVWSVPFTLLFSITGIWYFMERTNTAAISSTANPEMPEIITTIDSIAFERVVKSIDYNKAEQAAQRAIAALQVKDILPPENVGDPIYLTGISQVPLVRNRANRVYIDPETYEVIQVQKAEETNTVTWLNDIADPLHFGYWGGLITKIIWFVAGLGISGLVLTGIWISLKRKVKSEYLQKRQKMGAWRYVNGVVVAAMTFFMYYFVIVRYSASTRIVALVTIGLTLFIFLGWYIFSYQLKKAAEKELAAKRHA